MLGQWSLMPSKSEQEQEGQGQVGAWLSAPREALLARTPPRTAAKPGTRGSWPESCMAHPGCIRQTMPAPQWPLCVRFPQEERKEPSPVPASCWAGITTGGHWCPSRISGAQWGPDLTGVGRGVLFLSSALSPRGRKGLGNWGGDRGWGAFISFRCGRCSLSSPASTRGQGL